MKKYYNKIIGKNIALFLGIGVIALSPLNILEAAPVFNSGAGTSSTIAGENNVATGAASNAIGYENEASEKYSSAVGSLNKASGEYSNALGYNNEASGDSSSAIGRDNIASGEVTSAIGYGNIASGKYATAFGTENTASENSSAFGYFNNASGTSSSAFGRVNEANGNQSSAFGYSNKANGEYSSAFGYFNNASGDSSSAFGRGNEASGNRSSAFGYGNNASGDNSNAFGYGNRVSAANSTAVGNNNVISVENSVALGNNTNISVGNSVALGNGSTATGLHDVSGHASAGSWAGVGDAAGVISVGKSGETRQIQNVAAGEVSATSTDAVNGSQLYQVERSLSNVDRQINRLGDEIDGVGALSAAMAGLHPRFQDGNKGELAMAYGSYGGQSAYAVGGFYAPNEKVMFSVGMGIAEGGRKMGNVGINFALDRTAKRESAPIDILYTRKEVDKTLASYEQKMEVLISMVESQNRKLEAQSAEIESLKAKMVE